jgi:hypothetical protein
MIEQFKIKPIANKHISDGYIRCIIVGSSNSGKTYSLIYLLPLLKKPEEIFIFSTDLSQPIYDYAIALCGDDIQVHKYNEFPNPSLIEDKDNQKYFKDNNHTIFIFDDINIKQMEKKLIPFFTKSRHFNISVILIYQRFHDIPLTIRHNANLFLIFKSSFGYSTIYITFKQYFNNNKDFFDKCMNLLHQKKYKYQFICIDNDKYDDIITLNFNKPIRYLSI